MVKALPRQKAAQELENCGELAEPLIHAKLEAKPSLETSQRLESILKKLDPVQLPQHIQALRAVSQPVLVGFAFAAAG
jgi:hypothetical protein